MFGVCPLAGLDFDRPGVDCGERRRIERLQELRTQGWRGFSVCVAPRRRRRGFGRRERGWRRGNRGRGGDRRGGRGGARNACGRENARVRSRVHSSYIDSRLPRASQRACLRPQKGRRVSRARRVPNPRRVPAILPERFSGEAHAAGGFAKTCRARRRRRGGRSSSRARRCCCASTAVEGAGFDYRRKRGFGANAGDADFQPRGWNHRGGFRFRSIRAALPPPRRPGGV
mmetsp:Transcript_14533/g.48153  ORF Transcript_14533/g.48153 Transcript_14533/m.48153 type:complete len:229 (+) Transcript_14533:1663-2349(+)